MVATIQSRCSKRLSNVAVRSIGFSFSSARSILRLTEVSSASRSTFERGEVRVSSIRLFLALCQAHSLNLYAHGGNSFGKLIQVIFKNEHGFAFSLHPFVGWRCAIAGIWVAWRIADDPAFRDAQKEIAAFGAFQVQKEGLFTCFDCARGNREWGVLHRFNITTAMVPGQDARGVDSEARNMLHLWVWHKLPKTNPSQART